MLPLARFQVVPKARKRRRAAALQRSDLEELGIVFAEQLLERGGSALFQGVDSLD